MTLNRNSDKGAGRDMAGSDSGPRTTEVAPIVETETVGLVCIHLRKAVIWSRRG